VPQRSDFLQIRQNSLLRTVNEKLNQAGMIGQQMRMPVAMVTVSFFLPAMKEHPTFLSTIADKLKDRQKKRSMESLWDWNW